MPKTLQQLMALTEDDQKFVGVFRGLNKLEASRKKIPDFIPNRDFRQIIRICEHHKFLQSFCEVPSFDDHWKKCMSVYGHQGDAIMRNTEHGAFVILRDAFVFREYCRWAAENKYDEPEARQLLDEACKHDFYHALEERSRSERRRLHDGKHEKLDDEYFKFCDGLMERLCSLHYTPGYIESAFLLLELGDAVTRSSNKDKAPKYYNRALKYFYLAEHFELVPISQSAIDYAYNGEGIIKGNERVWPNFKNWDSVRSHIVSAHQIPFSNLRDAEQQAKEEFAKFKPNFQEGIESKSTIEPSVMSSVV